MKEEFITDTKGYKRRVLLPKEIEYTEPFWEEDSDKCGLLDFNTGKKYYAGKIIFG